MKELIKKNTLTKEQLEQLDLYYNNNIDELLTFDNSTIINFLNQCENILKYSITKSELDIQLSNDSIGLSYIFDEDKIEYYKKNFELMQYLNIKDYELGYSLGDFYNEHNDKENAIYYYSKTFKEGYDLGNINYYYSLVRYLELLNKNPSDELIKLINSSNTKKDYSLDYINTYLLLIINLEKYSDLYIKYIDEAIKIALVVVRKYQETNQSKCSISDTDEERNLCELLALKMEYYVYHKQYKKAYNIYKQLTEEIGKSDCTRYYHARDKFYYEMIKSMSNDYPELNYFNDLGFVKFKLIGDNKLLENNNITLQKEDGSIFNFKVKSIYENDIVIVPILPVLGEGGLIFTSKYEDNGNIYLVNKFSNRY